MNDLDRPESSKVQPEAARNAAVRLSLDDGTEMQGRAFGAVKPVRGEVVFNTAMTGYVEALTDPSYRGQILVLTYPLVGNYGVPPPRAPGSLDGPTNPTASRSRRWSSSTTSTHYSHHAARRSLHEWLAAEGIPALTGVDTRTLTRRLREHGTMQGWLYPACDDRRGSAAACARRSTCARRYSALVAPREPVRYEGGELTVLLVDAGAKDNIVRSLLARGASVIRAPWHADSRALAAQADGILIGNGPGDPKDLAPLIEQVRVRCSQTLPQADLRRLPGQPDPGAGRRRRHLQAPVWPPRRESAGAGPADAPLLRDQPEPRLRRAGRVAARGLGAVVREHQRRHATKASARARGRTSASSSTRRRARARRTPVPVRRFHAPGRRDGAELTACIGVYLPKKAAPRAGARLGRAADRPGRRVRLLRLAGDQGAARGRHRHGPGQPEHRDHPDQPGARRPHLPRRRDPGVRRADHRQGRASTRSCLSFGGQTALNCGLALHDAGVLAKHGVQVLGTPIEAIRDTEDRHLFVERLDRDRRQDRAQPRLPYARRSARRDPCDRAARHAARRLRAGRQGQRHRRSDADIDAALRRAFAGGARQVLVEECLEGWKEIEYEVVRDARDNCITVCNMENFDPDGHPHRRFDRRRAVPDARTTRSTSCCARSRSARSAISASSANATSSSRSTRDSADYRVIEVNARLSRSSALASKATGYPLAYVAAKLALGYALTEIPNGITRRTTAFFEPALDYLVCKFPRWDLGKFHGASTRIGSEMKSVGEVMAIGRTFAGGHPEGGAHARHRRARPGSGRIRSSTTCAINCGTPTPLRIFAIAQAIRDGIGIDEIHELTRIDRWFLRAIEPVVAMHGRLARATLPLSADLLRDAKRLGFSDQAIGKLAGAPCRGQFAPRARRTASNRASRRSTPWRESFPPTRTICTRPTTPTASTSPRRGARRS